MHIEQRTLGLVLFLAAVANADEPPSKDVSLEPTLSLIATAGDGYVAARECFSCHHQALPLLTAAHVRHRHPAAFSPAWVRKQAEFTQTYFAGRDNVAEGKGVPGGPYTAGYALVGLAAAEWPADEVTDTLVKYLFATQADDGGWRIRTHRPPLEDSHFTATALAVRGLRLFARESAKSTADERIVRAREWLEKATAQTNEDRAFRLLGLHWSDAAPAPRDEAVLALQRSQQKDGGWSQLDDRPSDAYATALTLVALRDAGAVPATDKDWQRGATWLVEHRLPDGSWKVESRSKPFQKYFESGFPHEKNQFISICATCWAVIALDPGK